MAAPRIEGSKTKAAKMTQIEATGSWLNAATRASPAASCVTVAPARATAAQHHGHTRFPGGRSGDVVETFENQ